ncbi:DUF4238 domain-containing protein [Nocardia pseudovaccinii]|uniref:DUF4238 domain-containing protein n=1 Tax=Nocardia pseudovaccinii TaxID=189540 RepID=UPI003D92DA63
MLLVSGPDVDTGHDRRNLSVFVGGREDDCAVNWTVADSVPNPWGKVPLTAGGQSVVPPVEAYMQRVAEAASTRDCVSRRHHYVPQSYMRAWSPDRKRVRVLDTRNGIDKLRGLRDTCVQENFYRVTDPATGQHNQVEKMLAVIDDETARLLQVLSRWSPGDDFKFDDFMSLAVVMGLQRNRTPQARRFIAGISEWSERRASQASHTVTADGHVDAMFRVMYDAADEFSTRQLELWDDPQARFITCDQPILLSMDTQNEPPTMHTSRYVWWPISPTRVVALGLELKAVKVVHRVASTKDVDEIRNAVIRSAESAIIAKPEDRNLPSGKRLRKRPQVRVDCEPIDPKARKCRLRFAWGHGTQTLDHACHPLCAVAIPTNKT